MSNRYLVGEAEIKSRSKERPKSPGFVGSGMEEDRVSNLVQNDGPANIIINNHRTEQNFKPKSPKVT